MFKCDWARISSPCGRHFLILGWNRNTKDDPGQWQKNGEPYDFDYVREEVIANGATLDEMWASAKHYKKLLDIHKRSTPNDKSSPTAAPGAVAGGQTKKENNEK